MPVIRISHRYDMRTCLVSSGLGEFVATQMSHKSGVAGKDTYLYAGVMTEAHQATTYCLMTLHRLLATPHTQQQHWALYTFI